MADDNQIGSGRRNAMEDGPQKRTNTAVDDSPTSVYTTLSSTLSRAQRHGGGVGSSQPSVAKVVDLSAKDKGRKSARAESAEEEYEEERFPTWARVTFWLLRKSIVPIIMIVMLVVGLYAGYTILGSGSKEDVFKIETWRHLYDLIFAES
ncbi:DNA-directed RNA polymerase subunit beta [Paenibacillus soyae]|uniref:DNA-directed RNA polymerase subunit beta n=1 Tax=Paenibacillus soyae TaxID=2969249 RepID=A0A9X2SAY6_9BACL|nr:DNA-directed RNA polymerase subunit beta [Paenibacillus soyae]MCR2806766.1 DNA-directed RNA polymerase subunit beta [Paenibacillus soyae]